MAPQYDLSGEYSETPQTHQRYLNFEPARIDLVTAPPKKATAGATSSARQKMKKPDLIVTLELV